MPAPDLSTLYPRLNDLYALRGNVAEVQHYEDFRIVSRWDDWTLAPQAYEFLMACTGERSLQALLDDYDADSQAALLATIQAGQFGNFFELLPEPAPIPEAERRYRMPATSQHPVTPTALMLHVNNACNYRCVHCYHDDYINPHNSLSLADVDDLAEQCAAANIDYVVLTGGEPFLQPNLLDWVEAFSRRHITVQINTNGSLITDAHLEALAELRVRSLSLSLDGPTAATHNAIRATPRAWDSVTETMARIAASPIKLRVSSLLHQGWLLHLDALDALIERLDGYGVHQWILGRPHTSGQAQDSRFSADYGLSTEQLYQLMNHVFQALQRRNPQQIEFVEIGQVMGWTPNQASDLWFFNAQQQVVTAQPDDILCKPHRFLVQMESNGDVPFCSIYPDRFPMVFGNIRERPLADLWADLCLVRMQTRLRDRTPCQSCPVTAYCGGGCPAEDTSDTRCLADACDHSSRALLPEFLPRYARFFEQQDQYFQPRQPRLIGV